MILWLTGNTGSGKTTLAAAFSDLFDNVIILDGDDIRNIFGGSLTKRGRYEQNIRVAKLALLLDKQRKKKGTIIVSVICPYKELRAKVKSICGCEFIHIQGGADNTEQTPYERPEDVEIFWRIEKAIKDRS
jgi:adenylylsulfate kinase-like enzyme